jgi:hypothetical protein
MTTEQVARFEKALLIAYIEAAPIRPRRSGAGVVGTVQPCADRTGGLAVRVLADGQGIGVVTEAGEVALPYGGGSDLKAAVLAQSLIVRVRGLTGTRVISGDQPPAAHWAGLQRLRERYALPQLVAPGVGLPEQLLA